MAYKVTPEEGETLLLHESFIVKDLDPFVFAISNQAVYLPRKKSFAISDPYYYERVALPDVRQVTRKKLSPYATWALAMLIVVAGTVAAVMMITNIKTKQPDSEFSGLPFGLIVSGLVMPFLARKRAVLVVDYQTGSYMWKPHLLVDRKSRQQVAEIQERILACCRYLEIRVEDETQDPLALPSQDVNR